MTPGAALRRYGDHDEHCGVKVCLTRHLRCSRACLNCSCGLDAELARFDRAVGDGTRGQCWYCWKPGFVYANVKGGYNVAMCDACRGPASPAGERDTP